MQEEPSFWTALSMPKNGDKSDRQLKAIKIWTDFKNFLQFPQGYILKNHDYGQCHENQDKQRT